MTEDKYAFEIPNVSCLSPRGRHTVKLNITELCLTSKKENIVVPLNTITRAYSLNKVDNYGKISACLWLLVLSKPVPVGKQTTKTIVFTTPPKPNEGATTKKKGKEPEVYQVQVDSSHLPPMSTLENFQGTEYSRMERLFATPHLFCKTLTQSNELNYFTSSRNGPVIKCYSNVNDGLVFPLPDGVFFVGKPYTFVDIEDMAGLECNKGGSGRTLDLNITTHDDELHVFGMVEKEEMAPLQHYIQMILKRAQRKAKEKGREEKREIPLQEKQEKQEKQEMQEMQEMQEGDVIDVDEDMSDPADSEEDDLEEEDVDEDEDSDFDVSEAIRHRDEIDDEDEDFDGENDDEVEDVYDITDSEGEGENDDSNVSKAGGQDVNPSSSALVGSKRTNVVVLDDSDTESEDDSPANKSEPSAKKQKINKVESL